MLPSISWSLEKGVNVMQFACVSQSPDKTKRNDIRTIGAINETVHGKNKTDVILRLGFMF